MDHSYVAMIQGICNPDRIHTNSHLENVGKGDSKVLQGV